MTAFLRRIRPDDPLRYDFAITRPGIRNDRPRPKTESDIVSVKTESDLVFAGQFVRTDHGRSRDDPRAAQEAAARAHPAGPDRGNAAAAAE